MSADSRTSVERPQEKTQHLHYLNDFRVEACPLFKQHQCQQHRPYTCFNWHFANQRRRRPIRKGDGSFNYSPDIYCDKYDENTGICPDGDECVYLHRVSGDVERKYHLRYYKTAQCVHSTDSRGQCVKNGAHCAFAHTAADLRLPQFDQHEAGFATSLEGDGRDRTSFVVEDQSWHKIPDHVLSCYKTEQCRKPARLCRQGYACPFYHNSKDRRRPPALFKYRSTPCPAAKTVDEWLDPELCEAGDNCQYCHTRTEQQFHPEIYKSTKCNDMLEHGYCPRAVFCAFAHHDTELHLQRTPYISSAQPSPKEQVSPNTNGGTAEQPIATSEESLRFGSPNSNGSTPTYSSVLKQRPHPVKQYSTNSDLISSSYPKAPGFERGPLSPNRADSALGRLRTHSLNMGHLDMAARHEFTGFDTGTHSSLCRSDSGFHAVGEDSLAGTLEELSLDLEPIAEGSRQQLTDLFGSQSLSFGQQMTSPVRIPAADTFHASPLTSFGESLFGSAKQALNSPQSGFSTFETHPVRKSSLVGQDDPLKWIRSAGKGDKELEDLHRSIEMASWEETLKQARQACEAWRADAQHYKLKAEQAEIERNRAIFERDQLAQQLEASKMHFTNSMKMSSDSGLPMTQMLSSDMCDLLRNTPIFPPGSGFNMFSPDADPMGPACARCGRDRSRTDGRNGCSLCSS